MGDVNNLTGSVGAAQTAESSLQTALGGNGENDGKVKSQTEGSGAGGTAEPELSPWAAQLTKETRAKPEAAKSLAQFKTIDELANSFIDLQSKSAGLVSIPAQDAKPEEIDALYKKLGKPENFDKYSFLQGDESPETAAFAKLLHEAHITDAQAQKIVQHTMQVFENSQQVQAATVQKKLADSEAVLKKEYGDAYKEKIAHFTRAVNVFGNDNIKKLLSESGVGYEPDIVRMFIKIGEQFGESKTPSGSAAPEEKPSMFSFKDVK